VEKPLKNHLISKFLNFELFVFGKKLPVKNKAGYIVMHKAWQKKLIAFD
jgi:hypothetical protein